jgi:hypothetical protein
VTDAAPVLEFRPRRRLVTTGNRRRRWEEEPLTAQEREYNRREVRQIREAFFGGTAEVAS